MRSRRSLTTALALALVLSAAGAPPALGDPHAIAVTRPRPGQQASRGPGATIVRLDERSGFDWADAGIGAAGGFALSVLGVGLVLLASEHRARRSSNSPAVTRSRSNPST